MPIALVTRRAAHAPVEEGTVHVEKRLSSRERGEPESIARLRSEATLLSLLSGAGVTPRLLDHGEDAQGPWHRMERVSIPTLAERIHARSAPLDSSWIERAVRVSYEALAAVHEAHDEKGPLLVVHADLSPANIAIDDAPSRAVVLDFDLAWWREGPPRTDGAFRGTIGYVAPEVARGERPTVQSDLFALAAALLHGATGEPPRPSGEASFAAILAMAAETPLLRPEHERLAARGRGHAALLSCLAHETTQRPASARNVLATLR